jgi:Zn finger protein HypA/HybF involved in hydrogenase expression
MDALDGNVLAGALHDAFEMEMTTVTGICRNCRASSLIAELQVYVRAPGSVGRCPHCGYVMLVVVERGGTTHAHLDGLDLPN